MQELMAERNAIKQDLNAAIIFKKKVGRELAKAEYEYKKERTKAMHRAMIEGYKGSSPVAATAVYNLIQGDEAVGQLRLIRDTKRADLDVTNERINQKKLELRIIESDIEAIRKGQ